MKSRSLPAWLTGLVIAGVFGALVILEIRRPLRKSVEPKVRHDARNLIIAGLGAVALAVAEAPVARLLSSFAVTRRWGILQNLPLPEWLEVALAVVLMDYTLYWWHVLTHRIPWLWRFHAVHHIDLDLDASTAIRFHFGELTQSVAWRAGQIFILGISPLSLSIWQTLLFASILFHHSNLRLPLETERRLNRFIVTPRMHGIHHSRVESETNSNWSSGLTLWDRWHGTLQLNIPQSDITIGVPACPTPADVTLPKALALPFVHQPEWWRAPSASSFRG